MKTATNKAVEIQHVVHKIKWYSQLHSDGSQLAADGKQNNVVIDNGLSSKEMELS